MYLKPKVGNDQEKVQSERLPTPKSEAEKDRLTIRPLYLENIKITWFAKTGLSKDSVGC